MSMRRKIQRGARKPPLSALDKWLYAGLIILGLASIALVWVVCDIIPTHIALKQEGIVAFRNETVWVTSLPFLFSMILPPVIAGSYGLERKQPIFGNRKFRSKGMRPRHPVYPLFSREFRDNLSGHDKKRWKNILIAWVAVGTVSLAMLPWGFFTRHTLDEHNVLRRFNSLNRVTHEMSVEDAPRLEITVVSNRSRHGSTTYHPEVILYGDGCTYRFGWHNFHDLERDEALEQMIYIKSLFADGEYEITNSDRLKYLLCEANAHRESLLLDLFDMNT